jgi:hypothetical protein
MKLKKIQTPLQKTLEDIDNCINNTNDKVAKYPLIAAKEIIESNIEYEMKFAGKMYDYGASARYPYENGLKFFKDKIN